MTPARILIVVSGPLSCNPRPLKEAETLGRAGYDVTVLLIRNQASAESQDEELMRSAPFRRVAVDMIAGHATGRGRIMVRRNLHSIGRKFSAAFGLQSIRTLGPAGPLLRQARALPADLTIVHNELPNWVGLTLLNEGRRVAADFEDWHSEDLLPSDRAGRPLKLIRSVEGGLLRRAAYTSTTSHGLADALRARYGGPRPRVIANSFPLQSDPHRGPPGDPPVFFWFSQTVGAGRGLELFFSAWGRTAQPSRVVLLGEPQPGYREKILRRLPPSHRGRVEFLPPVPPDRLPSIVARHDIGLALEQAFIVNRNLTITNKILQYLNAGLAVVASETIGQREVLDLAPGAGLSVDLSQTGDVARCLDRLLADRSRIALMGRNARQAAQDTYCWEREEPNLLAAVGAALETPPRAAQ